MLQFSIRNLLIGTLYCALGFAVSAAYGPEVFFATNLLFLHVAIVSVLSVASLEYSGHRKRFCIATLIVECLFAVWMSFNCYHVESFIVQSIIGFVVSFFAGICSAGTYRAICRPGECGDSWRPLDIATRTLVKILPDDAGQPNE